MADVDLTSGAAGLPGSSQAGTRAVQVYKIVYDAALNPTAAGSDTVTLMNVAAGQFVRSVRCEVVTAQGSAATIDIGDATDTDGFIVDADGNAAATDAFSSTLTATVDTSDAGAAADPVTFAPAYGFGKMYTAATALTLMGSIALTLFKANIYVEVVNYGT